MRERFLGGNVQKCAISLLCGNKENLMSTDLKFSLITTLLIVLGVIVAGGLTAALR